MDRQKNAICQRLEFGNLKLPIIGFAGQIHNGKDTAAGFLIDSGWMKTGNADPLRKGLLAINPYVEVLSVKGKSFVRLQTLIRKHGWDHAKMTFPEVRRLMQVYGTEGGREIHGEDCWLKILSDKILNIESKIQYPLAIQKRPLPMPAGHVVNDVRFINEHDFIMRYGLGVLLIDRGVQKQARHRSEWIEQFRDISTVIENTGTVQELQAKVERETLFLLARQFCLREPCSSFENESLMKIAASHDLREPFRNGSKTIATDGSMLIVLDATSTRFKETEKLPHAYRAGPKWNPMGEFLVEKGFDKFRILVRANDGMAIPIEPMRYRALLSLPNVSYQAVKGDADEYVLWCKFNGGHAGVATLSYLKRELISYEKAKRILARRK